MRTRLTQTNEPRRCATLLPFLASLEGPLALEVGASAGLCLYPDRWRYRYGHTGIGDPDAPLLTCQPVGLFTAPLRLPEVTWRAGLDLNPLDVTDADDVRWLEALIWPEQIERFVEQVTALPGHWISNEGSGVLPAVTAQVPAGRQDTQHRFLTALDGKPVAWSGPHGQSVELL